MLTTTLTDFNSRIKINKLEKLGRFGWYRKLVSHYKKQTQKNVMHNLQANDIDVFDCPVDIDSAIYTVNNQAVWCGLNLQSHLFDSILLYAKSTPCVDPKSDGILFYSHQYKTASKKQIYRGLVTNTHKCNSISAIAYNRISLQLATKFLGHTPTKITLHLTWSFPTSPNDTNVNRNYAPTNWHYDVVGCESLTLNFYITDIRDINSGPHQYIEKSHGKYTPQALLFSNNIINADKIEKYFGSSNKITLLGNAGFGFIENPTCIHRVKPPTTTSRLILQIRYS
ncbi:MAG: hypothetical protein KME29_12230 [Calothrix sp. FI2-JRJ7]|jgi:hypothetical protein|nr:hypothetical protein [Calothrix sp. FI2-JRJ7]